MNVLVIIPARGGSKGIPRKNLRALHGNPLIYYSIQCALASRYCTDVYVSSEDEEILSVSKKLGAKTLLREDALSRDATTLDPVIFSTYQSVLHKEGPKDYELIVTLQPTSPLLSAHSLDSAIEVITSNDSIDTVIAAKDSTHLSWSKIGDTFIPNYTKRVNRQYLTPIYTETGAFLITRAKIIKEDSRIGENVELFILDGGEKIDIDTYEDWSICEYYLRRKKVLFVVSGNAETGLGHVYNTLLIANDILDHEVVFLVDKGSSLARKTITAKNYHVTQQTSDDLVKDIFNIQPDIVINDILDTDATYISRLKNRGVTVINFEDLGSGAQKADVVVNAIYPERESLPNHYFGESYFILRDEFIFTPRRELNHSVSKVLLTFGGVDPQNLSRKVLEAIYEHCCENQIEIDVVAGFGYDRYNTLAAFKKAKIHRDVDNISDYMIEADVIFTSAGRTVYEVAALGVPAIVIAQNKREMTHLFANEKNGFVHLGLGSKTPKKVIRQTFEDLVKNFNFRRKNVDLMQSERLRSGRKRVQTLIRRAIEQK